MTESGESEWMAAMRAGDFARAWEINARDLRDLVAQGRPKHEGPRHLQRIWRGEPLAGSRVLVRCYHGLGDTLQFVRFARPLRARAREVTVWTQPDLVELVSRCAGVDRALPLHDGTPDAEFDTDIEIMELPFALGIQKSAISEHIPYIDVPTGPARPVVLGDGLIHVGLVWSAGSWDSRRSVPLAALAPLVQIAGVRLHRLQPYGPREQTCPPYEVSDLISPRISGAAANIRQLDLVITVDTMMAHLAGAMGISVWTLLCTPADWRWTEMDGRSIWYPTMRLFRQSEPGVWAPVISAVARELGMFASEHRNGQRAARL
jgi:hypothetical protein